MDIILQWLQAGTTPLLAILIWIIWQIKTNDLAHIDRRLSRIEGAMDARAMADWHGRDNADKK